tara:strand:+ start:10538 stop:10834 length:297 start_codon:yes stop_codon:yes gene_type:complete
MEVLKKDLRYRSRILTDIFDCCLSLHYFDCSSELIIKFKGNNFYNLIKNNINSKTAIKLKKEKYIQKLNKNFKSCWLVQEQPEKTYPSLFIMRFFLLT